MWPLEVVVVDVAADRPMQLDAIGEVRNIDQFVLDRVNNLSRSTNATTYTDSPPRPEQKRVWASLNKGKAVVLDEVFQEVRRRDPRSLKTLVAITDGEKSLQNLIRQRRKSLKVTLTLDFLHAMTYAWEAAHALSADACKPRSTLAIFVLDFLRAKSLK